MMFSLFGRRKKNKGNIKLPCNGCATGFSCQNSNLGKASDAGKGSNMTFCKYYNDYVLRRESCDHFVSYGCANGMCGYARHENGSVFCSFYGSTFHPVDSCPDFLDYFETEEGRSVYDVLRK